LLPCENIIIGNLFTNNTSTNDGGAIKYDTYPPTIKNNTFINNKGLYGNNVASYPVRMLQYEGNKLKELTKLENVPSGEELEFTIPLAIIDVSGEISKYLYHFHTFIHFLF